MAFSKAINFALTGSDRIQYTFVDRAASIVNWTRPSAKEGIAAVDLALDGRQCNQSRSSE
jgi:hypothetical protein